MSYNTTTAADMANLQFNDDTVNSQDIKTGDLPDNFNALNWIKSLLFGGTITAPFLLSGSLVLLIVLFRNELANFMHNMFGKTDVRRLDHCVKLYALIFDKTKNGAMNLEKKPVRKMLIKYIFIQPFQ